MKLKELQNLRYSNLICSISIGFSPSYATISFIIAQATLNATPSTVTWCNNDSTFKRFRSHSALYRALASIFSWPIHPDLAHLDQLNVKPQVLIL